jgi:HSP20 family protein
MTTMTRFVAFSAPLEDVAVLQNRLNSIFHDFTMPSNRMETESLDAGNLFLLSISMKIPIGFY